MHDRVLKLLALSWEQKWLFHILYFIRYRGVDYIDESISWAFLRVLGWQKAMRDLYEDVDEEATTHLGLIICTMEL